MMKTSGNVKIKALFVVDNHVINSDAQTRRYFNARAKVSHTRKT